MRSRDIRRVRPPPRKPPELRWRFRITFSIDGSLPAKQVWCVQGPVAATKGPMRIAFVFVSLGAATLAAFATNGLTLEQARARTTALRAELAHHDELYFRAAEPEITDAQYDALKRELQALRDRYPSLVTDDAVGDDRVAGFSTYRHRVPLLGLNKTHTETGVREFQHRMEADLGRRDLVFVVEPKYDGLSVSVTFEYGRLTRALTRGNGVEGDDVTSNLLQLTDVPRHLAGPNSLMPDLIELRGEVYMAYAEFKRINQEREIAGEEPFAHPRNLAVGTLRRRDADGSPRRLKVVFYGVGAVWPDGGAPRSQQELHSRIESWGLPGVSDAVVARSADDVWTAIQVLGRRRTALPFPIDGAVIKLDDLCLQAQLGASGEGPRGAIAYKYPAAIVSTRLTGIALQIGRTGVVTPVAEFDPVKIGGTTIRRATLHNRAEIARKDLRIGDYVFLEKAGEVIPVITGVDVSRRRTELKAFVFSERCPVCTTELRSDGPTVRCPNFDCSAQLQRRLEHFVSSGAVDISGLGKAAIASLVRAGMVKQPADLYALDARQLSTVTSARNADKLRAAIAASRGQERWRFIYGLGVPGIGSAAAKSIAREFTLARWINAGDSDYQSSAISAGVQRASLAFFADKHRREVAEALDRVVGEAGELAPSR